jgi:hypothetical protein
MQTKIEYDEEQRREEKRRKERQRRERERECLQTTLSMTVYSDEDWLVDCRKCRGELATRTPDIQNMKHTSKNHQLKRHSRQCREGNQSNILTAHVYTIKIRINSQEEDN